MALEALVAPSGASSWWRGIAGAAVAAHLGAGVRLAGRTVPSVLDVRRMRCGLRAQVARDGWRERAALPLYVDAPEVSRPAVCAAAAACVTVRD